MITKKEPELIDDSILISITKNLIPFQDKANKDINKFNTLNDIIKIEKSYILKKNKSFFCEFQKLYKKNILLKNKLNELLNEKKNLNHLIIKLEQKINSSKNKNNENNINNVNNNIQNSNKSLNIIESYRKKKRNRRKKSEINSIYNCSFNNCNKSYPTKGSLNMHIKLKHQNRKYYNFDDEIKK